MAKVMIMREGNKEDPVAFMKVSYCGEWGYYNYWDDIRNDIEKEVPDKFHYKL